MIRKEDLSEERLIDISASLALQSALVNEIYPEIRRVAGCLNHGKKLFLLLVIFDRNLSEECRAAMDGVFAETLVGVPENYEASLRFEQVDFPNYYEYDTEGWYCFYGFARHEDVDFNRVAKQQIALA